jgi:hypothetical protein
MLKKGEIKTDFYESVGTGHIFPDNFKDDLGKKLYFISN